VFLAGFLHIHTLLLTTYFKIKNVEKKFKNVKNVKKRDLNKKRKKTFITSMSKTTENWHHVYLRAASQAQAHLAPTAN